jgi:endonuclease/exonuclease/phosphatase family metal-dependent hydrolase
MSFRTIITVVLLLFSATFTAEVRSDDAPRIRAVSYNIHYGQGNDGKYNLERLAEVIKAAQPDLVGLQEVDVGVERSGRVHQARRLGALTGMQVRYGPTQHYQGGLYGNAVLTKLPILDVHIQPLPYTEATPELVTYPRGAIAVTVRGPDGNPLRFISTHFQHNVAEDRLAQAQAINRHFAEDEIPTILAGDMNALPDSEPIAELLKKWTNVTDDPPAPTAPSQNPRSRIDYIFSRPAAAFRLIEASVVDEPMASDHRPVLAVLELSGQ